MIYYIMLELYKIEGTSNIDPAELLGETYNTPETWPTFQEDYTNFKNNIVKWIKQKESKVIIRIFDGEFHFLKGNKVGNVGTRHCQSFLSPSFIKKFYDGVLACDILSTQLYKNEMITFNQLFSPRGIDIPMEFIYSIVANKWIFKTFKNRIALIGGEGKIRLIKELMKHDEYRKYIETDMFVDYISVPERFACDNTDEIISNISNDIRKSSADIFLFGIGISKMAIAHHFKTIKPAVYLDIGCGVSALAGTTSISRPYFGSWINYRINGYDYSSVDPIDFEQTKDLNAVYLTPN